MRFALAALFAIAGASAASAEVVQDRYGPPRKAAQPVALAALGESAYSGPLLGWSGKAAPRAEAPAPQPAAPQAYSPAPHATQPVLPRPQYAPRPTAAAPAPTAPPATIRPARAAAMPAPALASRPKPVLAGGLPETAPPSAAPRPTAAPRYYSLHREYGRAPDAIPAQATGPRYVLIGPPDAPPAPADQDGDESSKSSGQF
jgi:hypothetical protein